MCNVYRADEVGAHPINYILIALLCIDTPISCNICVASQGSDDTAQQVNRVLESLGWIMRSPYAAGGWNSTPAGRRFGASDHIAQSGAPYVKFEAPVVHQPALVRAFSELDRRDVQNFEPAILGDTIRQFQRK